MITRPTLTINEDDPTPPYEQLRRQLLDLIRSKVLAPGQRLPPVRQLAGDLSLAAGTVARTYRELEAAGLIQSRRGGGTHVANHPANLTPDELQQRLHDHAITYLRQAELLGADPKTALEAIQRAQANKP
jgi:DNA-binding transcriptional regulator YhcF (GntR family)